MSLNSFFGSPIGKQIGFTFVEIVCLKEHSQMKSFLGLLKWSEMNIEHSFFKMP